MRRLHAAGRVGRAPRATHRMPARASHACGRLPSRPLDDAPFPILAPSRQCRPPAKTRGRGVSSPSRCHSRAAAATPPPHHHAAAQPPGRACTEHGRPQRVRRGHSAADSRRPRPSLSNHRNRALGEPTSLPHLFPAKSGLLLAGFWSSPPAMAPEGYIALISVLPGLFP
jgi:hypothetical protein